MAPDRRVLVPHDVLLFLVQWQSMIFTTSNVIYMFMNIKYFISLLKDKNLMSFLCILTIL